MLPIEERIKVKLLWLAHWTAAEIAEFLEEPVDEIEALITIFEGTPSCPSTVSRSKPTS